MKYIIVASALALLLGGSSAFAPNSGAVRAPFVASRTSNAPLYMSEDPKNKQITTNSGYNKKEIGYDSATGRFFETNLEEEECVPDDEYCVVDKDTGKLVRLTLEEKERIFLDALQSFYFSGRQLLTDDEFDLLREDLSWNGSKMVEMSAKEVKFITAKQAYMKGETTLTDAEFDELKNDLKEANSMFVVSTEPKCYIDTGICTVTLQEDKFRTNLLYLPAGSILTVVWLFLGFELIEPVIRLNPIILLLLGAFPIYKGAIKITDSFIFQDNFVVYGPCPSCEVENRVYFGDILFTEGFKDVATSKCPNCKTTFQVQRNTLRASTVPKA